MATFTDVLAIKVALDGLSQFQRDIAQVKNAFTDVETRGATLAGLAGGALVAGFVAMGAAAVKSAADIEAFRLSMDRALGSQGQGFVDRMMDFATKSAFGRNEVIEISRQFIGMGFAADEAEQAIGALSDAVAAVGGDSGSLALGARALSQIKMSPTLRMQEVWQLVNLGIPVLDILEKQTGKSRSSISAGQANITGQQAYDALLQGFTSRFGGAQDALSNTLYVRARNLFDALATALEPTGRILLVVVGGLVQLVSWGITVFGWLNKFTGGLAGLAVMGAMLIGGLTLLQTWFRAVTGSTVAATLAQMGLNVALVAGKIAAAAAAVWQGVLAAIEWLLAAPVVVVAGAVILLVAALYGLYKLIEWIVGLFSGAPEAKAKEAVGEDAKLQAEANKILASMDGKLGDMKQSQSDFQGKLIGRLARKDIEALIGSQAQQAFSLAGWGIVPLGT